MEKIKYILHLEHLLFRFQIRNLWIMQQFTLQ